MSLRRPPHAQGPPRWLVRRFIRLAGLVWLTLSAPWAVASPTVPLSGASVAVDPAATVVGTYGVESFGKVDPSSQATTSVGGGTFDLNTFLGAGRYYGHTTPITGQNTIATNLEAGHFWNGHETLQHVATNTTNFLNSSDSFGGAAIAPKYDRHATWAAMLIGGRASGQATPEVWQQGIAPGTELRSGAVATTWSGTAYALSFGISVASYVTPYTSAFGVTDVVNSSYGYTDPGGTNVFTIFTDAMSFQNPRTLHVASAGNSINANTVGAPGSGYNTLTVAALGNPNAFDAVAWFSSRGPQNFGYVTGSGTVTVNGVRAPVDLAAPGVSIVSAFYGGQNGGNNATLPDSVDAGSDPTAYSSIDGTSFAAPIVAGGATLVASAAKTLAPLVSNSNASQSMVVKSLLLTGADKTTGWSNGQQSVTVGGTTFLQTTQSLDWALGAGRMNLDKTFDIQVNGQIDVSGTTGLLGPVSLRGWDFGSAVLGTTNDYVIADILAGGSTLTTTLSWMRARDFDGTSLYEDAQADLDLSVWALDGNDAFTTLIASSASDYNTVEHLSFTVPAWGRYGLRIAYGSNTFDNTGGQWGSASFPQDYGLAWTAVPEPATVVLLAAGIVFGVGVRRQRGPPPGPPPDDTG
jgi:hypothetical protein